MIQRRVLVTLLAVTAVTAACKGADKQAPAPGSAAVTPGGAGRAAPGSAIVAGSGSALGSAVAVDPTGKITRPFFYKVEKAGKTSYLLGTWHLGIDAEKQMPPSVWTALDGAKAFAMEVDPADPIGLTAMKRTDGRTLEQDLGPEYWPKLETIAGPIAAGMKQMKPVAAAMFIQFKDMPQTVPMDLAFITRAKDQKKQLVFLESAQSQVRLLERWVDLRMLKAMIDDLAGNQKKTDEALAAYLDGDDATLVAMVLDREGMKEAGFTDAELDQAADQMLYERNAAWIPALEQLFTQGDAFVAVGAGHLIGPKSVVELLQAKGYTVTRIAG